MNRRHLTTRVGGLVALAILGCSGSEAVAPVAPARLEATPSTVTFTSIGDTAQLTVRALTAAGVELTGVVLTFTSTSPAIATVDGAGRVVAVGNGSVAIRVSAQDVATSVSVTVAQVPKAISVSPAQIQFVAAGDTARLTALVADGRGNPIMAAVPTWRVLNPVVASVDGTGLVTAFADGQTDVLAMTAEDTATARVIVQRHVVSLVMATDTIAYDAIGDSTTLIVVARDARGIDVPAVVVTWETSDAAVATVSPSGVLTAVGNGSATIRARTGSLVASRAVRVLQRATSLRVLSHPPPHVVEGEPLGDVRIEVADRNRVPLRVPGLSVSATLVAPAPNAGQLTGTRTADIVNGIATFNTLTIDRSGPGYRIRVGNGTLTDSTTRVDVSIRFVAISLSNMTLCARDARSDTWCWGRNYGEIAGTDTISVPTPKRLGRYDFYNLVVFGDGRTCGINLGATTRCWGGFWGTSGAPVGATALKTNHISVMLDHHCALVANGETWCWGNTQGGSRGTGIFANYPASNATQVTGGHAFAQLSFFDFSTCGLRTDGALLCWGSNDRSQLGVPLNNDGSLKLQVPLPTQVIDFVQTRYQQVSMGSTKWGCALAMSGRAYCWGDNSDGRFVPQAPHIPYMWGPSIIAADELFTKVLTGPQGACGLSVTGRVHCWGNNAFGELGIGSVTHSSRAAPVLTPERFVDIAGDANLRCGLTARGLVHCWGVTVHENGTLGQTSSTRFGQVLLLNTIIP